MADRPGPAGAGRPRGKFVAKALGLPAPNAEGAAEAVVLGLPGTKPVGRPGRKPFGRPPVGTKPMGKAGTRAVALPAGKPVGLPAGKSVGLPAGKSVGRPAAKPVGRPAGKPADAAEGGPVGLPAPKATGASTGFPIRKLFGRPQSGAPTGAARPFRKPEGKPLAVRRPASDLAGPTPTALSLAKKAWQPAVKWCQKQLTNAKLMDPGVLAAVQRYQALVQAVMAAQEPEQFLAAQSEAAACVKQHAFLRWAPTPSPLPSLS